MSPEAPTAARPSTWLALAKRLMTRSGEGMAMKRTWECMGLFSLERAADPTPRIPKD